MNATYFRTATAGLAFAALALATGISAESRAQGLDPEATQILRQMTDYLGSLQRFSLHTQNTLEEVFDSGQKIQYDFATSVVIQRPNKAYAERRFDLVSEVVIYDGKTLTAYNADSNYYAVIAAPDNLDDMLHFARDALDIVPPSADLIFSNSFELLTADVTSGVVVGKSMIGGVKCDHLAFSGPIVDWQVWIADEGKRLPHKYVITTKDDPARPQYMILMSDWNVAPSVIDGLFKFTPPPGAKKTEFLRLDTGDISGR
jgi:hypothetical protein